MKTVKLIEKKQTRLNRLFLQGSISKEQLRESLQNYAQFVAKHSGE